MINKFKTFAIAILVTGATVTSTRAPAATVITNSQVLENISVQIKLYGEGPLKTTTTGKNETLPAQVSSLTTADLITQLGILGGFATAKSDKLVTSTIYSNYLVGTPGTVLTNFSVTLSNVGVGTSVFYYDPALSEFAPISNPTNSYLITNVSGTWEVLTTTATQTNAFFDTITSPSILTNGPGGATVYGTNVSFNTNSFYVDPRVSSTGGDLFCWATIVPVITPTATNIVITQYSPITNLYFTNASSSIAVLTGTTGTGTNVKPTLMYVTNWLSINTHSSTKIYNETGLNLSATNDFFGTNVNAGQIVYLFKDLGITAIYTTNGQPANNMNYSLDPTGFVKQTDTKENLTVGGKASQASYFDIPSSATWSVGGSGWVGGTFAGTNTFTVVGGYTNYNTFANSYVGTNYDGAYISGPTNVVFTGTITETFLKAYPQ